MANCPFCSSVLLRHVRAGQMYWFCRRCRTEVLQTKAHQAVNLSTPLAYLIGAPQCNLKLHETSPSPVTVYKD